MASRRAPENPTTPNTFMDRLRDVVRGGPDGSGRWTDWLWLAGIVAGVWWLGVDGLLAIVEWLALTFVALVGFNFFGSI